jgi:hypothetical protein
MNRDDCGDLAFQDAANRAEPNAGRVGSNEFLFAEALATEAEAPILRMCVPARVHALIRLAGGFVEDDMQALGCEDYSKLLLRTCALVLDLEKAQGGSVLSLIIQPS